MLGKIKPIWMGAGLLLSALVMEAGCSFEVKPTPPQTVLRSPYDANYGFPADKVQVLSGTSISFPHEGSEPRRYRLWGLADHEKALIREEAGRFVERWFKAIGEKTYVIAEMPKDGETFIWVKGENYEPLNTGLVCAGLVRVEYAGYADAKFTVLTKSDGIVFWHWKRELEKAEKRRSQGEKAEVPFQWMPGTKSQAKQSTSPR